MRLHRFVFALCSLVLASATAFAADVSAALDRFGRFLVDTLASPGKPLALVGMPSAPMSIGGTALARTIQQGLRHEAGVSRRAAPRNV